MYKFIACLLLVVSAAFADKGPVNQSVTLDATGSRVSALDQYFVNVKNQDGAAMSAGQFVILDVSNDDGYSVVSATGSTAVPHCMVTKSCAASAVCECQTYGYTSAPLFLAGGGTATAGEQAFLSSNAGYVEAIAVPAAADKAVGVFYDSPSADGTTELFLKMR